MVSEARIPPQGKRSGVHLVAGDNVNWALNDDLRLTRQSIESSVDLMELDSCDVIHALWWEALLRIPPEKLVGKKVICHLANQPFHTFTHPIFHRLLPLGVHWVTQSTQAHDEMDSVGIPNTYIPYSVDIELFHPVHPDDDALVEIRQRWNIPPDRYLIGSFQRDTLGRDLNTLKAQKGPDVFAEVVNMLHQRGHNLHVILAGPRRHWLRRRLDELGVPYTYIGQSVEGLDDTHINNLNQTELARLYSLIDLYLVASRWEGGPRATLEAAACRCKVVSTHVGLAEDILESACIVDSLVQAAEVINQDIESNHLHDSIDVHFQRVSTTHIPAANESKFAILYSEVTQAPPITTSQVQLLYGIRSSQPPFVLRGVRRAARVLGLHTESRVRIEAPEGDSSSEALFLDLLQRRLREQSIKTVESEGQRFDARLVSVSHSVDSGDSSFRQASPPIGESASQSATTITILPSAQRWQELLAAGKSVPNPVICPDTIDPVVYYRRQNSVISAGEKVQILLAQLPGDSPSQLYVDLPWLNNNLDWSRFECTLIGPSSSSLKNIRTVAWSSEDAFAALLRQHHLLIQLHNHDRGPYPLLAALSSGLPVLYHQDDRSAQACVGFAGLPFQEMDDLSTRLDRLIEYHQQFSQVIVVRRLEEVSNAYATFFRLVQGA